MPDSTPPEDPTGDRARRARGSLWLVALGALVILLGAYGLVSRLGSGPRPGPEDPGELLQQSQAKGTPLTAVGRLRRLGSSCTAWLVDVGAAADAPAYAVTAGRCVGIDNSTPVVTDRPAGPGLVEFHALLPPTADDRPETVPVAVGEVAWASMRWTDLAVLRLRATYGELASRGVLPIRAAAPPEEGSQLLVAGVPIAGVPEDLQYLRGSRCQVGRTTDVLEYRWMFQDMVATDCTGILRGSAGSPAFDAAGQAVGMATTTTIGARGGKQCYLGQPCEVRDGGVRLSDRTTYLVHLQALAGCFPGGRFALGGPCTLEDPAGVVPASSTVRSAKPGTEVTVRMVGDPDPAVEVADVSGPLAEGDCSAPKGWSSPVPLDQWSWDDPLPDKEGWTLLCVGSPAQPTPVVLEADGTAPDPSRIELSEQPIEGGVRIEPVLDPPELVRFFWVAAPADGISCETAEGYVEYRRVPATIQADDLPRTVCVKGMDEAGNVSRPATFTVQ